MIVVADRDCAAVGIVFPGLPLHVAAVGSVALSPAVPAVGSQDKCRPESNRRTQPTARRQWRSWGWTWSAGDKPH